MVLGEETHGRTDFELVRDGGSRRQFDERIRKVLVVLRQRGATRIRRATARRDMGVLPHEQRFEAAVLCPLCQFDGRDRRVRHHRYDPEFRCAVAISRHKSSPIDRKDGQAYAAVARALRLSLAPRAFTSPRSMSSFIGWAGSSTCAAISPPRTGSPRSRRSSWTSTEAWSQ